MVLAAESRCAPSDARAWKAGVASVVITPEKDLWMAGYASRNKPAEGKETDLYGKALAIEDARGTRLVVVTLDLIGVPRRLAQEPGEALRRGLQVAAGRVVAERLAHAQRPGIPGRSRSRGTTATSSRPGTAKPTANAWRGSSSS